jgi:YfiH family protein
VTTAVIHGSRAQSTRITPHHPPSPQVYADAEQALERHQLFPSDIILLHQVHSAQGYAIPSYEESARVKNQKGDFLITTVPHIALGILTADCASVVISSNSGKGAALIHAGWRGVAQDIIPHAFTQFLTITHETAADCTIVFGPSARSCCYRVDAPFLAHFEPQSHDHAAAKDAATVLRDGAVYFDLPAYISAQLRSCGIDDAQIQRTYNECTICNDSWCSYRRNPTSHERQFTLVMMTHATSITP